MLARTSEKLPLEATVDAPLRALDDLDLSLPATYTPTPPLGFPVVDEDILPAWRRRLP